MESYIAFKWTLLCLAFFHLAWCFWSSSMLDSLSVIHSFLLIYLAALGLSCSIWDLILWPVMEPQPLALGAWILVSGSPGKSHFIPSYCWTVSVRWIDHVLFCIHSPADVHLGDFHFGPTMNNAVMNIHVQISEWTYIWVVFQNEISDS